MYSQQSNSAYFPPGYGVQYDYPSQWPQYPPPPSQYPTYQPQPQPFPEPFLEQMQANVPPVSPGAFTSSFSRQSFPQRPQPSPMQQRRNSTQKRWDEYLSSDECPDSLQADRTYIAEVTQELEQRAASDTRIEQLAAYTPPGTGADPTGAPSSAHAAAAAAERDRRLKWAQSMIISNPALCAEVYWGMTKRAGSGSSASGLGTQPMPQPQSQHQHQHQPQRSSSTFSSASTSSQSTASSYGAGAGGGGVGVGGAWAR